jgi:hypothetical protein
VDALVAALEEQGVDTEQLLEKVCFARGRPLLLAYPPPPADYTLISGSSSTSRDDTLLHS